MNIFESYLDNILVPQLASFDVPDDAVYKVAKNIKNQMYSLIQIWNDTAPRNTILLTGLENGRFYDSSAPDEIKTFVAVAIRNSMFETLSSVGYKDLGLSRMVTDDEVKKVTSAAIDCFCDADFSDLALQLDYSDTDNIYLSLKEKYPLAWNALEILANGEKANIHFPKLKGQPEPELTKQILAFTEVEINSQDKLQLVRLDGYSEKLDDRLLGAMKNAYALDSFTFFVPCFKMITRNINKLFRTLDFFLCCNAICITANYYISNGHVQRREPLIAAGHNDKDSSGQLQNFDGLQAKHARILKAFWGHSLSARAQRMHYNF